MKIGCSEPDADDKTPKRIAAAILKARGAKRMDAKNDRKLRKE